MLRILGRQSSSNVQKLTWLLSELSVEYQREDYGGKFGGLDNPDYLARNPHGLIPTLIDGDFTLWESNSICRYLANQLGATSLYPSSPQSRALCERWMDWQLSTLAPALSPLYIAVMRPPARGQAGLELRPLRERAIQPLRLLNKVLSMQRFVQEDHLTLADICTGIWVHRWFAVLGGDTDLPNLRSWYARLSERDPYRKNVIDVLLE
jgi:glutathione S-transferase